MIIYVYIYIIQYTYIQLRVYKIIYIYMHIYAYLFKYPHCNSYTPQQFLSQLRNSLHPSGAMPSARKEKDCDDLSAAKGSNAFG